MRGIEFGKFRLLSLGSVGSTNDLCRALAQCDEPGDIVVRAVAQRRGRGRHSRSWLSPSGNLYASLLLRPSRPLMHCASLSLVAGLAMRDALAGLAPDCTIELKWPNDLLIDGKKVAGLLLEGESDKDGQARFLIVGSGVNLASAPEGIDRPVTSLAGHGVEVEPAMVLKAYLKRFDEHRRTWCEGGFAAIRSQWMRHAYGAGLEVSVKSGRETLRGLYAGLDDDGNLRLLTGKGQERVILSGELAFDVHDGVN